MIEPLLPVALLVAAPIHADAPAASPMPLTIEQETALRCSAVFAIVSREQARHALVSEGLPQPGLRGREYFVVTTARLMDETSAMRAQVAALFKSRHAQIMAELAAAKDPRAARAAMLTPCLALLEAELDAKPE
ncbi:MAG: hypothetical protein ABIW31_01535 [Novosphingobium sp.]